MWRSGHLHLPRHHEADICVDIVESTRFVENFVQALDYVDADRRMHTGECRQAESRRTGCTLLRWDKVVCTCTCKADDVVVHTQLCHPLRLCRVPGQSPGEAEDSASIRPSTKWRSGKMETWRSGLDVRFSTTPLLHFVDRRMGSPAATRTSFASIRPSVYPQSGEAEKWRSGKVEKRSSGLDVRFSAWTKSFATQRQMVSFASIRPSVHPSATRRSGEAVKWRSGVVDWTSAKRCHLRPST
jgi:hypothetical protein